MTNIPAHSSPSIDEIVLQHDKRGISQLRNYLPADNYLQTAAFALEHRPTVMIATGFYVNGTAETDGPPGALALAHGFSKLGSDVHLVSDRYCIPLLEDARAACNLIDFPITGPEESRQIARSLLDEIQPSLLISIERCGITRQGFYRNMRGIDLSPHTARLDFLFETQQNSIGIGDGGNEIGMGLLYDQILLLPNLIPEPTIAATTHLLISTVSNWAAYGLLAAMSQISGVNLLPGIEQQRRVLHQIVDLGATNGISGRQEYLVDGFDDDVNDGILRELEDYVTRELNAEKSNS